MLLTIIVFIIILGVLVLAHELGHFVSAKKLGVNPIEFGLGLPPRIFGFVKVDGHWKKVKGSEDVIQSNYKNTVYSLNWLPLGGFVNLGEDNPEEVVQNENSFSLQKPWKRFIMLFSGVGMNLIFAFICLSLTFALGISTVVDENNQNMNVTNRAVQILEVTPNSPAAQAGIQPGDAITEYPSVTAVKNFVNSSNGEPLQLKIKRDKKELNINVTPTKKDGANEYTIGIGLIATGEVHYPVHQAIWQGAKATVFTIYMIFEVLFGILKDLFSGTKVSTEVSGPVGIAVMTGQVVRLGWIYVLQFAALLSINLAIINILPFPALDGGRILFLIIEKIKGARVKQKYENLIHQIGFYLIILLMVFIIFKDLKTYIFN